MELLSGMAGRVLFAIPFVAFGCLHFAQGVQLAGLVPSWVPGGIWWVYIVGVCMVAAGVSILTKKMGSLACKGVAGLLLLFILTVHLPGILHSGPSTASLYLTALLKDMGLMGGALVLAGVLEREEV